MLALIVLVWTLSNGELSQHEYLADQQFPTIESCKTRGTEVVREFSERVDEVIGVAYMCIVPTNTQTPAPPGGYRA